VVAATLAIASCSQGVDTPDGVSVTPSGADGLAMLDGESVAAGSALYATFCASCHADDLSGGEDWKTRNDDGSYRPPPQDSTGHTWHHSDRLLVDLIANGSDFSQTRMPSFGDVLTDEEILSILDYFKSTWGEQERHFQWEVTQREVGAP
jgi:mono/diheme cytochrome c family protein